MFHEKIKTFDFSSKSVVEGECIASDFLNQIEIKEKFDTGDNLLFMLALVSEQAPADIAAMVSVPRDIIPRAGAPNVRIQQRVAVKSGPGE
jgi:hypothetical protein